MCLISKTGKQGQDRNRKLDRLGVPPKTRGYPEVLERKSFAFTATGGILMSNLRKNDNWRGQRGNRLPPFNSVPINSR